MLVSYRDHVQNIAQQHWKGGGGYLGESQAFLWDEALLTMQEWIFGKSVSTFLQVIVAPAKQAMCVFTFCEL